MPSHRRLFMMPNRLQPQREITLNVSVRKISDVQLNSEYLRLDTDVASLKKSLESVGLIHPVTINADDELLAGARRFQAAKELGWEEIAVHVVDRDVLVQELISIDENLVRSSLNQRELEKYLNRGREIYESLHPAANKVDLSSEELSTEEKAELKVKDEADEDSFAAVIAEKTGLSKSVIKGAIKRDALASDAVKKARGDGELNATKANEIIKLEKETQEQVLPLIADKTAKETRRIVAAAKEGGLPAAIEASEKVVPLPREYSQMLSPMRRVNKSIGRILAEELRYEGPEQKKINNDLMALKNNLIQYFEMMGVEDRSIIPSQARPEQPRETVEQQDSVLQPETMVIS
ncbi:MAG: ParB family chromosome partitioning protein [Planctomycetota bacterium]|jgi:ParB family chromosome partitioning protein